MIIFILLLLMLSAIEVVTHSIPSSSTPMATDNIPLLQRDVTYTYSIAYNEWKYFQMRVPLNQKLIVTVHELNFLQCQLSSFLQQDTLPTEEYGYHLDNSFTQQTQILSYINNNNNNNNNNNQDITTNKDNNNGTVFYLGIKGGFCYEVHDNIQPFTVQMTYEPIEKNISVLLVAVLTSALGSFSLLVFFIILSIVTICITWKRRKQAAKLNEKSVASAKNNSLSKDIEEQLIYQTIPVSAYHNSFIPKTESKERRIGVNLLTKFHVYSQNNDYQPIYSVGTPADEICPNREQKIE
jgi:hypothetical protein